MLRVDLGHSVKRRTWQTICRHTPRVVGVVGQPGGLVHLRFDATGFIAIAQGCSADCELGIAKAIIEAVTITEGHAPLAIWTDCPNVSVN